MATLQVRIDDKIKSDADLLFNNLGLDTSTAIRMFITASLKEGGIPFPLNLSSQNSSLDKQIISAINSTNPKRISLSCDDNGNIIIDKNKHPDLYDWAVNG